MGTGFAGCGSANGSSGLCLVSRQVELMTFFALLVSQALNLIVAFGNWQLYRRVEKLESNLGLQATPQSQHKSSSEKSPQNRASARFWFLQASLGASVAVRQSALCLSRSHDAGKARVQSHQSRVLLWEQAVDLAIGANPQSSSAVPSRSSYQVVHRGRHPTLL